MTPTATTSGPANASLSVAPGAGASVNGNTVSATKTGSWGVTASVGKISATTPLSVNSGPATSFEFSTDDSKSPNQPSTTTVTAKDAYGNIATGYNGTVKLSSNDTTVNLPANLTLSNGVGTFNETSSNAPSITATDMNDDSITGFQAAMNAGPNDSSSPHSADQPQPVESTLALPGICVASLILVGFSVLALKYRRIFTTSSSNFSKIHSKTFSKTSLYKLLAKNYVPLSSRRRYNMLRRLLSLKPANHNKANLKPQNHLPSRKHIQKLQAKTTL